MKYTASDWILHVHDNRNIYTTFRWGVAPGRAWRTQDRSHSFHCRKHTFCLHINTAFKIFIGIVYMYHTSFSIMKYLCTSRFVSIACETDSELGLAWSGCYRMGVRSHLYCQFVIGSQKTHVNTWCVRGLWEGGGQNHCAETMTTNRGCG